MRCLDLFAGGCNGFGLAAQWMGWETVACVEIDKWNQKLLKQNFPEAKLYGDIREFNEGEAAKYRGRIDLITGGFPCQNISAAGQGEGINGKKSSLWFEMYLAITKIHPGFILIENSDQITRKGLEVILFQIAEIGYNAEWETFFASEFGHDHRRPRTFIFAYPSSCGWKRVLQSVKRKCLEKNKGREHETLDSSSHPFLRFRNSSGKSAVFGVDDGLPTRLDVVGRLGCLGNAVVPQIPYDIYKAIESTFL